MNLKVYVVLGWEMHERRRVEFRSTPPPPGSPDYPMIGIRIPGVSPPNPRSGGNRMVLRGSPKVRTRRDEDDDFSYRFADHQETGLA